MKRILAALILVTGLSPARGDEIEEGCHRAAAKVALEAAQKLYMPTDKTKFGWHINSKDDVCYAALKHFTGPCKQIYLVNADTGKIEAGVRMDCLSLNGTPLPDFGVIPSRPSSPLAALKYMADKLEKTEP